MAAMMYPVHVPSIPLRWDEQPWLIEPCPTVERCQVEGFEQKQKNEKVVPLMQYLTNAVCDLRADAEGSENDEADEVDSVDLN